MNLKRTRRLWIELGLRRQFRRRKTRKLGTKPGTSANSCTNQPARFKNDVWTYDFIADRTLDGGTLKWLSLVDEYTRECLALCVGETVTGADVRRILARVIGRRGAPTRLRSDNGSEFICAALAQWLPHVGARSIPVAPASPWENGFIEREGRSAPPWRASPRFTGLKRRAISRNFFNLGTEFSSFLPRLAIANTT